MKTFKNKKKLSGKKKHSRLINKKCTKVNGQYKKYSKLKGGANVIASSGPSDPSAKKFLFREKTETEKLIIELNQKIEYEINAFIFNEFKIEPETKTNNT